MKFFDTLQKRHPFGCGTAALLNALIWTGQKLDLDFAVSHIMSLIKEQNQISTTKNLHNGINNLSIHFKSQFNENISLETITNHLKSNGSVILLHFPFKDANVGHYTFLTCKNGYLFNNNKLTSEVGIKKLLEQTNPRGDKPDGWLLAK